MVGPPSDVINRQVAAFLFYRPLAQKEETPMRWLGDLIVYGMVAGVVGFFVYVAIQSNKNSKDEK